MDEFIGITMPFVFASLTILFGSGVENYASNNLKISLPEVFSDISLPKNLSNSIKEESVKLAVQVYIQLGYLFSVFASCISCIAYTLKSPRPILAAIGAFILAVMSLVWFFYWQSLTLDELKGEKGKLMRIGKWASIIISYLVTLFARYY